MIAITRRFKNRPLIQHTTNIVSRQTARIDISRYEHCYWYADVAVMSSAGATQADDRWLAHWAMDMSRRINGPCCIVSRRTTQAEHEGCGGAHLYTAPGLAPERWSVR